MKHLKGIFLALIYSTSLVAQDKQEIIKKEVELQGISDRTLWIDNINGSIAIEAYDGPALAFEIIKYVKADYNEELTYAWEKLNPLILTDNDTVEVYIDGFCACDCKQRKGHYYRGQCDDDHRYDFNFDFKVRVPENLNLRLSTVNHGDISVTGMNGKLKVNNVNGSINLEKVSGVSDVHTVNGDVNIKYARNPSENSRYYTLNGKLTVYFLPDLTADMNFKSFNGEFFTDFDITEVLPAQLITSRDHHKRTTWKIEDRTSVRIGNGGITLDFETFNGDIYIRKL